MDPWEIDAREQIRDLLATHTYLQDSPRYREVLDLYTDDAVLEVAGQETRLVRDVLRATNAAVTDRKQQGRRRVSWHQLTNVRIEFVDCMNAHVTASFMNFNATGIDHWGRYSDDLHLAGNRWLLRKRRARIDGRVEGSWAPPPPATPG